MLGQFGGIHRGIDRTDGIEPAHGVEKTTLASRHRRTTAAIRTNAISTNTDAAQLAVHVHGLPGHHVHRDARQRHQSLRTFQNLGRAAHHNFGLTNDRWQERADADAFLPQPAANPIPAGRG